ncbi:hypothetical protein [Proteus mirabilis]|uniref:hypothetical protein n=1 Tax=Proteus mirabilis TaxID=584 RepID=UPI0034D62D7E
MKTFFLKLVFFSTLLLSASAYADKSQYVRLDLTNNTDEELINVEHSYVYRIDKGTNVSEPIGIGAVKTIKAKGNIGKGPGYGYVYKIHDNLYLDILFNVDQDGKHMLEICFSSKHRTFRGYKETFGDKESTLSCDMSIHFVLVKEKIFDISYGEYSIKGVMNGEKVGAFNLYAAYSAKMTLTGPKCSEAPKARLDVSVYEDSTIRYITGYYAMIKGCPYFSYCPESSNDCTKDKYGYYRGDFYALPTSDETRFLFRNKDVAVVSSLGKLINYNIKPINREFKQKSTSIRVGDIVPAEKLEALMRETNKEYCAFSKKYDNKIICGEPKYTLQKRPSGQLKYLPVNELKNYDCFVDSITYPNIGSNVCYLKNVTYKPTPR